MHNQLKSALSITIIVFVCVLLLSFLPAIKLFNYEFVPIDFFAGIKKEETIIIPSDSLVETVEVIPIETCKEGLSCFEDYSTSKKSFSKLYEKLHQIKRTKKGIVRIAVLGDSFIEGDVMVGDLRDTLQAVFGGKSVGYIPAKTASPGHRITVLHEYKGIQNFDLVKYRDKKKDYFISGEYFTPERGNHVKLSGSPFSPRTKSFDAVRILYGSPTELTYTLDGSSPQTVNLEGNNLVNEYIITAPQSHSIKLSFHNTSSKIYGIYLEPSNGVIVDNYFLRGNPGNGLNYIDDAMLEEADRLLKYDLIVLQYGLNMLTPKTKNFVQYHEIMVKAVKKFQQDFPHTAFLLVGISDKGQKVGGEYVSQLNLTEMIDTQRKIAADTGIVFWDLFTGMGGAGTAVSYVNHKPILMNKDYTHLTHKGGEKVADILFETFYYDYQKYEKQK